MDKYKVYKNGDNTQSAVVSVVVDDYEGLAELPNTFGIGSDCLNLKDSSVWILGNDRVWHQI